MMIALNSRARNWRKEKGELKGKYGGIWGEPFITILVMKMQALMYDLYSNFIDISSSTYPKTPFTLYCNSYPYGSNSTMIESINHSSHKFTMKLFDANSWVWIKCTMNWTYTWSLRTYTFMYAFMYTWTFTWSLMHDPLYLFLVYSI